MVLNFAGKVPWSNDKFASLAMIRENTPLANFSNDIGTKSSGNDFPDIEARMTSTSSSVTRVMSFRVAQVYYGSDINGSGAVLPIVAAIQSRMSRTFFQELSPRRTAPLCC